MTFNSYINANCVFDNNQSEPCSTIINNTSAADIGTKIVDLIGQVVKQFHPTGKKYAASEENRFRQEYVARTDRLHSFLFSDISKIPRLQLPLYEKRMASLRFMHTLVTEHRAPLTQYNKWTQTLYDFGGIDIRDHSSYVSAKDFLFALKQSADFYDCKLLQNAKTVSTTIDSQAGDKDSWLGVLSHVRADNGLKHIIFQHGEYAIKDQQKIDKPKVQHTDKNDTNADVTITTSKLSNKRSQNDKMEIDENVCINENNNNNNKNARDSIPTANISVTKSTQVANKVETIYNEAGLNWDVWTGSCSDGGSKELAGMHKVCIYKVFSNKIT